MKVLFLHNGTVQGNSPQLTRQWWYTKKKKSLKKFKGQILLWDTVSVLVLCSLLDKYIFSTCELTSSSFPSTPGVWYRLFSSFTSESWGFFMQHCEIAEGFMQLFFQTRWKINWNNHLQPEVSDDIIWSGVINPTIQEVFLSVFLKHGHWVVLNRKKRVMII